jgi:hypothetical protein
LGLWSSPLLDFVRISAILWQLSLECDEENFEGIACFQKLSLGKNVQRGCRPDQEDVDEKA